MSGISNKFGGIILPVGVPPGGTVGQVLTKASSDDYDIDWEAGGGGGGGMTPAQVAAYVGGMIGAAFAYLEDADDPEPPTFQVPAERGPAGSQGLTGRQGDPVVLQPEDPDDVMVIPGDRGAQGNAGAAGRAGDPVVLQPEDPDDAVVIVGDRGLQGIPGVSPAPVVLQAEDPDDFTPMPGDRGPQGVPGVSPAPIVVQPEDPDDVVPIPGDRGATGARGLEGLAIVLQPDDPELPLMIPGERGATGPAGGGGGGGSMTEIEVDFGAAPVYDAQFTITDGTVTAASKIMVNESGNIATGRVASGDSRWDSIAGAALPAAGSFTLFCKANPGPVVGKRKMLYMVA